ncbi:AfsR/SARP family transcriptional regulator [Paractinoplanes lichenicola]|uniref:Tetratricopeptide repeat protein n=1 Tax=Paractinoplanes lichenicola TaxID=2802976 RepID=A0ABS1VFL0_9ACTN|nr:BTAD domain-containing putative transcriptional regulator [Actinoplanes lichenicola]MBL7253493.1 tetratricopeptide repeat protein [Actinoplanes lichenicola]
MLRFTLLGAVEVWRDGQPLGAGHPRQRAVLAFLLAEGAQPAPTDVLIDRVWGDSPPPSARQTLHAHIARLRRLVQPDAALTFASGCYVLAVEPEQVDVHRFGRLVARAAEPDCPPERGLTLLREAMELWQGEPMAGLTGDWAEQTRQAWQRQHVDAAIAWSAAERHAGHPAAAIPLLTDLTGRHPLHEPLALALMEALDAAGRPAEALAHYDTIRRHLQEELGADPGPALQRGHRSLLGDAEPRPAQLPAAPATFVGRDPELAAVEKWHGEAPAVAVVGPAGVGKTALALRWAWSARTRFPDGQLYVDLRGFGDGEPIEPADALDRMLRALATPPEQIALDVDERSAQLRSRLADRRVLLILDNAASARQVRPLLPGHPGCLALVTSRSRLDGLVAQGVRRLPLAGLSAGESATLLHRIAELDNRDDDRLTGRLVDLCAGLPLAVSVVAARLDGRRRLPAIVRELEDEGKRLAVLDDGEDDISVRRALGFSVRALDATARRSFALLSAHPGQTPGLAACAALLGTDPTGTRPVLDRLAGVHLLERPAPSRYRMHDLVRLAAREQAAGTGEHDAAQRRVLTWYRDVANTADRVLRPAERPNFASPSPLTFGTAEEAMAWLDAEADNLTAAVLIGCRSFPEIGWQIAAALYGWLVRRRHLERWIDLYRVAADAAVRAGDTAGEALIRGRLPMPYSHLGRNEEAAESCRRAYELRLAGGDRLGAATALLNLGAVHNNAGNGAEAIRWLHQAATLSAELTGAGHLRALTASNLGEAYLLDLRIDRAIGHFAEALELARQFCGPRDVAEILRRLAETCNADSRAAEAARYAEQAADQARTAGDALLEAESMVQLGRACLELGRVADGQRHLRRALAVFEPLDPKRAAAVRELL